MERESWLGKVLGTKSQGVKMGWLVDYFIQATDFFPLLLSKSYVPDGAGPGTQYHMQVGDSFSCEEAQTDGGGNGPVSNAF